MRSSRHWCALPVLLGVCLLSWSFLLAHAQPSQNQDSGGNRPGMRKGKKQHSQEEPRASRAATDDSAPSGLVVVRHVKNSPQQDRALYEQALKNAFINGVGFQIHWSDIEPVE